MLVPDGDDCFTVTAEVVPSPQFYAWLFGFAGKCEVLSPGYVRDEYCKKLRETAELYG